MATLSASLNIAVQALNAATGGIQITNNNIANANTAGYTREVAVTTSQADTDLGDYSLGNGVDFTGYQSIRDELLQGQIRQETQSQSGAEAQLSALQAIEPSFTTSSSDIGTEMTALFSSLSELSTDPTDSSLRESVLTAGQNLATAFNTASETLTSEQSSLNEEVGDDVEQINQITSQIAALNPQIASVESQGKDAGTLKDQQDELLTKLSALTNVSVTDSDDGITVTTGNGTALVTGNQSYALSTVTGSSGQLEVLDSQGNDITGSITAGDLGGTLVTRDQTINGLLSQLDTLANGVATAFNSVQTSGYDENGDTGTDFFTIPTTVSGSAASIKMAFSDPALIAASTDESSGGGGNLSNFAAIATDTIISGETPSGAYASLVYQVGSVTATANAEQTAATSTLSQLNDQLSSVSGVSIDEEATNLIQYQQSYEAAAHVISTIQTIFTTLMDAVS